jgi:hypothetical protein
MSIRNENRTVAKSANGRANQLAKAQNAYRDRMRGDGFLRLQEWLPEAAYLRLKYLCEVSGLTKREAIVCLISAADDGKFELGRSEK